jgi:hypothetical protein
MSQLYETSPERIAALHAIRDRHPSYDGAAQRRRMLEAMQTEGHITTFEAMRFLDCFDPRPRKLELLREGYPIVMTWRYGSTESGKRHRIGVYSLTKGAQ